MKENNLLLNDDTTAEPTPVLKLLEGGKDDNWLMGLAVGTVFLAKEHFTPSPAAKYDRQAELAQFTILHKWKRAVEIEVVMGPNKMTSPVDSLIFSRKYDLIEVILIPAGEGIWVKS